MKPSEEFKNGEFQSSFPPTSDFPIIRNKQRKLSIYKLMGKSQQNRDFLSKHRKQDSIFTDKISEQSDKSIKNNSLEQMAPFDSQSIKSSGPLLLTSSSRRGKATITSPEVQASQQNMVDPLKGYNHLYKIILLGKASSGKTSLLIRFVDERFEEGVVPTIGADLKGLALQVEDHAVRLQIWDT